PRLCRISDFPRKQTFTTWAKRSGLKAFGTSLTGILLIVNIEKSHKPLMLENGGRTRIIPAALLAMLVGVTLNVLAFAVTFGQLQARVMGLEDRLGRIEER